MEERGGGDWSMIEQRLKELEEKLAQLSQPEKQIADWKANAFALQEDNNKLRAELERVKVEIAGEKLLRAALHDEGNKMLQTERDGASMLQERLAVLIYDKARLDALESFNGDILFCNSCGAKFVTANPTGKDSITKLDVRDLIDALVSYREKGTEIK